MISSQRQHEAVEAPDAALACTIVCGPGAAAVTRLALSIYEQADVPVAISILTPRRCAGELNLLPASQGVTIRFDEDVEGFDVVRSALQRTHAQGLLNGRSVGWYLQQYLKLADAWRSPTACFIHDGDTVFSPHFLKRLARTHELLTTREGTDSYNVAARAVGLPIEARSFVANGGLFYPDVLRRLHTEPAEWFLDVMDRGVLRSNGRGDFSEYQIMGALLKEQLPMRRIAMFRRFDLLSHPDATQAASRVRQALARYDAVAFEAGHHSSLAKRWAGHLAYALRYSW